MRFFLVFSSLFACKAADVTIEQPLEEANNPENFGPEAQESSSGTLWDCELYTWGTDGFEEAEGSATETYCFDGMNAATDYTDAWVDSCESNWESAGIGNYECTATCYNSETPC